MIAAWHIQLRGNTVIHEKGRLRRLLLVTYVVLQLEELEQGWARVVRKYLYVMAFKSSSVTM